MRCCCLALELFVGWHLTYAGEEADGRGMPAFLHGSFSMSYGYHFHDISAKNVQVICFYSFENKAQMRTELLLEILDRMKELDMPFSNCLQLFKGR